jgi:hypothetical protein
MAGMFQNPTFTLSNPDAVNIYYQWDGVGDFNCGSSSCSFGLENAPNNAKELGIKIFLKYWSNISCLIEDQQEKELFIDLKNPVIKNLVPANNSFVNDVPVISAYIDEVQGLLSSGVNLSSINMKLNGSLVSPLITAGTDLDAYIEYIPPEPLADGIYTVYVNVTDNAGRYSEISWEFEISQESFEMHIFLPNKTIYDTRRIPINIFLSKEVEILEYKYNEKDWRTLCRKCNEYGFSRERTKSFADGSYNLSFRATDEFGNFVENSTLFFIDSKAPRIYRTGHEKFNLTNWNFTAEFREDNPKSLILYYANISKELNLSECSLDDKSYCNENLDLSLYDGQEIEYYFYIEDVAGNSDTSRANKLVVDITPPIFNFVNYSLDRRNVYFNISITEINFDKVIYIYNDSRGRTRERILCSRLNNGICEKRVSFSEGEHNLTIIATDKFGNANEKNISFFIDSVKPRIYRTEPRNRAITNGSDFYIRFREENPKELNLVINETDSYSIDFSNDSICIKDRSYTECNFGLNLTGYNGEETEYYFFIKDVVNNTDESRPVKITIDTEPPKIKNDSFYTNDSRYIYFDINITEENLDKVALQYDYNGRTRETRLCTRLVNGICEKRFRYRGDYTNFWVIISDKAGNFVNEEVILV